MKDRAIVLWLLVCLIGPVMMAGSWLEYKRIMVRRRVKMEMLKGMDRSNLVLIKLTEDDSKRELDWEFDDEFEFNDEMYDMVDKEVHGDTIYYWCWTDQEETVLNQQIDQLLAKALGKDSQRKESQKRLTKHLKSIYYYTPFTWRGFGIQTVKGSSLYFATEISVSISPPDHPPESC